MSSTTEEINTVEIPVKVSPYSNEILTAYKEAIKINDKLENLKKMTASIQEQYDKVIINIPQELLITI